MSVRAKSGGAKPQRQAGSEERQAARPKPTMLHLRVACALAVALAALAAVSPCVAHDGDCQQLLETFPDFAEGRLAPRPGEQNEGARVEPDFYFFLHIPRSAGRTLNFCLMKAVFHPKDRCFSSYGEGSQHDDEEGGPGVVDPATRTVEIDRGPLDALGHPCRFAGTHDDLSVLQSVRKAPGRSNSNMAVFTQLRDPVDRALSAYEFTVRTASRYFHRTPDQNSRKNPNKTATNDVWPWIDLIPIVQEDMRRRHAERKAREREGIPDADAWVRHFDAMDSSRVTYYNRAANATEEVPPPGAKVLPDLDPYDNEVVMPLSEFVRLPEVRQVIHNNQAYQVLGATNISGEHALSRRLRSCAGGEAFDLAVVERAKGVLDRLWHVSVFEDLEGSISSLMRASGWDLGQRGYRNGEKIVRDLGLKVKALEERARDKVAELDLELDGNKRDLIEQHKLVSLYEYDPDRQAELKDAKAAIGRLEARALTIEGKRVKAAALEPEQEWVQDDFGMPEDRPSVREVFDQCVDRARSKREEKNKIRFMGAVRDTWGRQILWDRSKIAVSTIEEIKRMNRIDTLVYEHAKHLHETCSV